MKQIQSENVASQHGSLGKPTPLCPKITQTTTTGSCHLLGSAEVCTFYFGWRDNRCFYLVDHLISTTREVPSLSLILGLIP